jgi:adenylosuccinate lyase/3-carboxy-cis,cis-muconate cycloisomerase
MNAHPFDFDINPNVYSTPELVKIFDEKTRYQRWLDFEAALAKVQGEMGIIPIKASQEISNKAHLRFLDIPAIQLAYQKSRNSIVPLLNGLRNACDGAHGEYVHYGATTQDVIDTSEVLEIKDTIAVLYRDLLALEDCCLSLTKKHCHTPMVARTHGQQALPTTFGLKTANWLCEIRRNIERLKSISNRLSCGQFGGAVGTLAALGQDGLTVAQKTLEKLGLNHPGISWHTARDNIGEFSAVLSLTAMTLAKIANEVYQLQKIEIAELFEPAPGKAAASSTMPHKQNPVISQRIVALSRHVRYLSGTIIESMAHEHERDGRCLWSEWLAVPQISIYTGTALKYTLDVIKDLSVREDNMLKNLYIQKNMITSEWLLFRLSSIIGKMKSLDKLRELSKNAVSQEKTLKEMVIADAEIGSLLSHEELSFLDHPEKYLGQCVKIVEDSIHSIEEIKKSDPVRL